jgi:hypothetical protein
VGVELVVDELGEGGGAEGALHLLFGSLVLAVVQLEALETGEVAALAAGEDAFVGGGVRR